VTTVAAMSTACAVLDGRARHDESATAARYVAALRDRLRGGVLLLVLAARVGEQL
jgi:hypothetical protein